MGELERPVLAVDVVVLCLAAGPTGGNELAVVLHRRREAPFAGRLGLPGVAVLTEETLQRAARRALVEKVGLPEPQAAAMHVEQLATFDALYRDPRGRTVSVAYLGLARDLPDGDAIVRPVAQLEPGSLPFDHNSILQTAVERLRGKLRYSSIAAHLLPENFRIEELRAVYEAVLGRSLNRSNFRSKLLKIGVIERVGVDSQAAGERGGRPPHLFRFCEVRPGEMRDFI